MAISTVTAPVLSLQDDLASARRLGLVGAAAVTCLSLLLLQFGTGLTWGHLLMLALYLAHKGYVYVRASSLKRKLRLEALFVAHSPAPSRLRRCWQRRDHLWQNSLTLQGLRAISQRRSSSALDCTVAEDVAASFDRSLAPLRLPRFNVGLVLVVGVVLTGLSTASPDAPLLFAGISLLIGLAAAADVHLAVVHHRQHQHFAAYLEALVLWALEEQAELLTPPARPYQHVILYRAPRWFAQAPTASASSSPLRRLA